MAGFKCFAPNMVFCLSLFVARPNWTNKIGLLCTDYELKDNIFIWMKLDYSIGFCQTVPHVLKAKNV